MLTSLRLVLRGLLKRPSFTVLVLATLGVGIGATTAIFSAVDAVMLRPLAVRDPSHLVMLWESNEERGWHQVQVAPANAFDWRAQVSAFEDVALVNETPLSRGMSAAGTATIPVTAVELSGNALSLLGARPMLGRTFRMDETWSDAAPVVVLGHDVWLSQFHADSGIVGKSIRLDGTSYEVIGVLAAGFKYPVTDTDLFVTFRWTAARRASIWFRQAHVERAIARLKPGVSLSQASQELAAVSARLEAQYPTTNRAMRAGMTPLHRFLVGDRRLPLLLLLGAVGLLQLIVCANVANLMLVRALTRRQELAVRSALGAGRRRLVWEVLGESLAFAVFGSIIGLMLGVYGLDAIQAMRPEGLPDLVFRLDWRMLAFTAALAVTSAVLAGIHPALVSSRIDVQTQLAEGGRTGSTGRSGLLAAHFLTAFEVAIAVTLVAGAGLLLRSIGKLREVDPGVNMENVLTFEVSPPSGIYRSDPEKLAFAQRFLERIGQIPGVVNAGAARVLPFTGPGWSSDFTVEGWPADRYGVEVRHFEATAGYFRALQVPLLEGDLLPDQLLPDRPRPVLVNKAFVDRYFPGESPLGRRVTFDRVPDSTSYWYTIIGVVGNERMELASETPPQIIGHLSSDTPGNMQYVVKTATSPSALVPQVRAALAAIDPEVPLRRLRTMNEVALDALAADRYLMVLLGVFAVVALGLAVVGVYGVAAQAARARTREIGIRLALGATARDVLRTLMTRGLGFATVGVVAGIGGALASGRVLGRLLFRVEPTDPLTLVSVAALLLVVALAAIVAPARKATRLDPRDVLTVE